MTDAAPIVVHESFEHPLSSVWQAITDPNQMRQWYFDSIPDFRPEVGFQTEFNVSCEGRDFLHQWKVVEVSPEDQIAYQWRYKGFEGDSLLEWKLVGSDAGTDLTVTHSGQETFQGDPLFSRENGEAGWNFFVKQSLKNYLDQLTASK